MKTIVLSTIAVIAVILLISEPASEENFLLTLALTKLGGIVLMYVDIFLYQKWHRDSNLNRFLEDD
jgi:hypothetical protein